MVDLLIMYQNSIGPMLVNRKASMPRSLGQNKDWQEKGHLATVLGQQNYTYFPSSFISLFPKFSALNINYKQANCCLVITFILYSEKASGIWTFI